MTAWWHRLIAATVVAVLVGGGAACTRGEERPEGIVERWLQAISDQGRDNLADEAAERAAGYQRVESGAAPGLGDRVVAGLMPPEAERRDDERLFEDLEVGQAVVDDDRARVPFRVTRLLVDGEDEVVGTVVLVAEGDEWEVAEIDVRRPGELVPSEGGDRPADASATQWLVAGLMGLAFTAAMVAIVEAQPAPVRPEDPPEPVDGDDE